jgi:ketosteroid isomerase-like protein
MKYLLTAFLLVVAITTTQAQQKDEQQIRQLLSAQTVAWNKGDLEAFMTPYWHSDSLLFIGKSGVKYGWAVTLANYKKGYPDTAAMGKLHFDILEMRKLSDKNYFVVGKWHLQRSIGDIGGHFTLLWRKIKGQWVIVADHSS